MTMTTIYALIDPRTDRVRYVGKTSRMPQERLAGHVKDAKHRPRVRCQRWLRTLLREGLDPVVRVLDFVEGDGAEAERAWIAHYRAAGADLCNLTEGGDGTLGFSHSPASRARISAGLKGRPVSADTRAQISRQLRGHQAGMTGRRHSEATKAKQRATALARGNGRLPLDVDWLVDRYRAGASHDVIAAEVGVSGGTVRRRLLSAGVPMRSRTAHLSQPSKEA